MRLTPASSVPRNARSAAANTTLEAFLANAVRQGYLDLQRVGDAKGAQKKRGRITATQANGDESVAHEWRWDPRAMAEVGEHDIARFMADFMVERTRGDPENDDDDVQESKPVSKKPRSKPASRKPSSARPESSRRSSKQKVFTSAVRIHSRLGVMRSEHHFAGIR